jgi:hypothetical protein
MWLKEFPSTVPEMSPLPLMDVSVVSNPFPGSNTQVAPSLAVPQYSSPDWERVITPLTEHVSVHGAGRATVRFSWYCQVPSTFKKTSTGTRMHEPGPNPPAQAFTEVIPVS